MSKILNNEEMAELMAENNPQELAKELLDKMEGLKQPKEVLELNLSSTKGINPSELPILVNIQERISEAIKEDWGEKFKPEIRVSFKGISESSYKEHIKEEDEEKVYFVISDDTLGPALLTFDVFLIVSHVDAMLHGDGNPEDAGENINRLSMVEQELSKRIAQSMCETINNAWEPVYKTNYKLVKVDTNSQFLAVAPSSEPCAIISNEISIGEYERTGEITICYPETGLEEIIDELKVNEIADTPEDSEWKKLIKSSIMKKRTDISFEISNTIITVGEFLSLSVGDILETQGNKNECLVKAGEEVLFLGEPIDADNTMEIQIIEELNGE